MSGDFVLRGTPDVDGTMMQVPTGHCWVVGDNLTYSRDSRIWGPLPLALVTGKVIGLWTWGSWMYRWKRLNHGLQDAVLDEDDDEVD
ncbi:hypothetical protein LTR78_000606 [Recurvomyces mirabilis]|uniref:Peptidase S26 domain-containing protein n=1 Tax=Recurvomyces mirabilis TaxID=574656 RepID=A0AAE0WY94_9PEZI|nr:hypothetical protein LTR78_000606 [Recurvomyces mirabilis]KAK5162260.1 hypothetical protein LTS14_000607 [Recurvomyces mirabilis]